MVKVTKGQDIDLVWYVHLRSYWEILALHFEYIYIFWELYVEGMKNAL